jgi:hypothetical protein
VDMFKVCTIDVVVCFRYSAAPWTEDCEPSFMAVVEYVVVDAGIQVIDSFGVRY